MVVQDQPWQQQQQQGLQGGDGSGMGLYQESSTYLTASSLGTTEYLELGAGGGATPKKAPGLKKKLKSSITAARADAALG